MSEQLTEAINAYADDVVADNDLTLSKAREEPMPTDIYANVLKDVLDGSDALARTPSQRDIAMAGIVDRLRRLTGDDTLDSARLLRRANAIRVHKIAQRHTGRLHY